MQTYHIEIMAVLSQRTRSRSYSKPQWLQRVESTLDKYPLHMRAEYPNHGGVRFYVGSLREEEALQLRADIARLKIFYDIGLHIKQF